MLAIVDYDHKFLFVGVGCQGEISDGGIFRNSVFNKALERDKLNLPDPALLSTSTDPNWLYEQNDPLLYAFVADDAFPLGKHCMEPYRQTNLRNRKRLFNYRLSRMRRISKNCNVYNCNSAFTGRKLDKEFGEILVQTFWSIFPRTKTTMHKSRQRRSEIHLLIIFTDPGLFHGNGM